VQKYTFKEEDAFLFLILIVSPDILLIFSGLWYPYYIYRGSIRSSIGR